MKALEIGNVKITSGFWKEYQELILKKVIPYQWDILNDKVKGIEKSHAIDNFRIAAGISNDKFYGEAYQDSDLYKWLEAVGNALQVENNIELEKKADEVIDLLEGAQEEDGYLNTYFQLVEPEKKWSNILECHELYCAGHLIEAAIAYYKGTGKDKILKIACKLADCINEKFGPEEWKMHGLFINILYDRQGLKCTSGVSRKTFVLDKTLEEAWDQEVKERFLTKYL